jgi:hypothetical protein
MRLSINHIDKIEFLTAFKAARNEAMNASNIRSGFAATATGLVPLDLERVLKSSYTTRATLSRASKREPKSA